jgi:DNA-binding response OmpR family regulator
VRQAVIEDLRGFCTQCVGRVVKLHNSDLTCEGNLFLTGGREMNTVLILEDDPGNMNILCSLLWARGYRVLEATTGNEAMQICKSETGAIDLLISDLQLPDLCGTEVASQLQKSHPELSILFVSGRPLIDWTERDLRNLRQMAPRAVDFLEKPFGVSMLVGKMESLLNRRKTRSQCTV